MLRLKAEMERGVIGAGKSANKLESGQDVMARPNMRRAMTIQTEKTDPFSREMAMALEIAKKKDGAKQSTTERARPDVHEPLREFLTLAKARDAKSGLLKVEIIQAHLLKEGRLDDELANYIILGCERLLRKESNVLELKAPITVCGDVHGQFYDLIALFNANGYPSRETPYLFLGDYVDRGYFGTEVCFLLFSFKILDPESIFMLRGNHECRALTKTYSFKRECTFKYSLDIYDRFCELFDCLPLAATVPTKVGTFLCLHGGISPFVNTIDDIREVDRYEEVPQEGPLCDLLWADPLRAEQAHDGKPEAACSAEELEEWSECRWQRNMNRGVSYFYGWGALEMFLESNELVAVVRAHEVQQEGYEEMWFGLPDSVKKERKIPPCITVFSAPNYCDMYRNKASYLKLSPDGYTIGQLTWVSHPFYLPNFMSGFQWALPFLWDSLSELFVGLVKLAAAEDATPAEREELESRIGNIRKWNFLAHKLREERQALIAEAVKVTSGNDFDTVFHQVQEWDKNSEIMHPSNPRRSLRKTWSSYF